MVDRHLLLVVSTKVCTFPINFLHLLTSSHHYLICSSRMLGMGMLKESDGQRIKLLSFVKSGDVSQGVALLADVKQQKEGYEQLEERSYTVFHATGTAVC